MTESILVQQNLSTRLKQDKKFKQLFLRTRTRSKIASQLRRLRTLRECRQVDLKSKGWTQPGISRIEHPKYSSWSYRTLMRFTEALDGVLEVNILPFEEFTARLEKEEQEEARQAAQEERERKERERLAASARGLITGATKGILNIASGSQIQTGRDVLSKQNPTLAP